MSKYLERVNEILKNANSKKITDKKKCVVELLDLYENAEAIQEICKNSETDAQSTVHWSHILHAVHKILLNEADRFACKDVHNKAAIAERRNTCLLVQKTFQHANSYKVPLLKCKDIMPLILQILGRSIYEYYLDTYINVLISSVLPLRTYQVDLLPEHWEELLKICINLYSRISILTSKRALVDALQMIIENGCLHCNLLLHVKATLLFLENLFIDVKANEEILADSSYKLTSTVCLQIATEYRMTLCRFSENVLPNLISLKGSVEKYRLLLFFVRIHHPKGACKSQDGACANDWEKWHTILKNIYLMILKDFKADVLSKSFIYLATEVFRQILENSDLIFEKRLFDECDFVQTVKRRRITVKVNTPIDMLIDNNPEDAWPIVQILTILLKKYPECLKLGDFSQFLKVVVDLLTLSCKEEDIMGNLYELVVVLLLNEKVHSTSDIENSSIYWDQIWDILLRSLNVNQNETSTHKLTQLYIMNNKVSNPNALLKLYVTNVIKWSITSVRTLIIFCEHFPLPTDVAVFNINFSSPDMNSTSIRLCLIKWILNIPWQKMATQIIVDELCLLLLHTTLKAKYKKLFKFEEYNIDKSCDCLKNERNTEVFHEYIEECYLLLKYKRNLWCNVKKTDEEQKNAEASEHVLYMSDIVSHLMINLSDMIKENASEELHIIIVKIAIIAKVVSMMKQLSIITTDVQEIPLVHSMKNYLNVAYTLLENVNPSRSKYVYLSHITKTLNILYGTSYDSDVAKIIVSFATLNMLKNIFSLMNIQDNEIVDYTSTYNYYDYDSFQSRRKYSDTKQMVEKRQCDFCNKGTIRIQATKALALFCCTNVGEEKCEIQVKLMTNLLKINMYDLSQTVDFKMAIIVLKSLSKYGKDDLWKNHKEIPLENLLQLHRTCFKDETALRYILNVLPYIFHYAMDYNCNLSKLMEIVSQLRKHQLEKKYGVAVSIEFIKSLSEIILANPSRIQYTCEILEKLAIIKGILSSFNSFSFDVQLEIIHCVQKIYSSKTIPFKWKKALFQRIEESVNNLILRDDANDKVKADKKEVVVASTLFALTAVVSTDATFQSGALLAMLRFVIDKSVDIRMISKALCVATSERKYLNLIENNLSYLLTYWFSSKYASQSFPWKLTQCESEKQFYETYIDALAFIKFQNLDLQQVTSLSNYVNVPFERIVENIFPQILSWLFYCINENNGNVSKNLANKVFHKMVSNQDEFSRMKKFSTLFNDKFEDVLIYLIGRLHDEDYLEQILNTKVSFAMSDPPHFKEETVNACLRYMEENFFNQGTSIQNILASNCPNVLQKILLYLVGNISKGEFEEHRVKAFHQYIYFCTLITDKLKENYFDAVSFYVIKDIGYSLLHVIKMYEDSLRNLACEYFLKFLKHVLPERNEEVEEMMNFTVMTLVPIAQISKTSVPLKILKFLIIDQKEILSSAIEKLNSFPNVHIFQEIRNVHNNLKYKTGNFCSLEGELQHFLSTTVDKDIHHSVEDVVHLRIQLSTRKEELQRLYNKLETFRGFAEDYVRSMLPQLVHRLIKLTASSDLDVSIEAARCLGELGPTDITSMILYFQKSHVRESSDLIEILTYKIVTIMVQFLFQSDVNFRQVSANILYIIFSSTWGQKLLNAKYMEHLKNIIGESETVLPLPYIQPFLVKKSPRSSQIGINYAKIHNIINPSNAIWTVQSNDSYSNWITTTTRKIAECFTGFYIEHLIPACVLSTDICEVILPRIIFLVIRTDEKFITVICNCIDKFFEYHFLEQRIVTNCDQRIVRCMLNIVNYVRIQVSDNFINLNYMYVAKAAQYCSAYFTAILYAEMSCETHLNSYNNFINLSKIDYIYELLPQQGKEIQSILRDSYTKIGDTDAIRGTGSSHLQDHSTRIQHYVHTNEWNKVMLAQDVELSFGNMTVVREMAKGLHQSGLEFLYGNFISSTSKGGEKIDEDIQYECAWRLSNWNICEGSQNLYTDNDYKYKLEINEHDYHFHHYQALKYFHEGNEMGVQSAITNARISIIQALRNISLESSKSVYEKLMQLQLIREIEDIKFAKEDEYEKVLDKWQQLDVTNFNEFEYIEPILTQRTVIFQINDSLNNSGSIRNALFNTYLQISKIAADKDNLHIATRSLAVLAKQKDLTSKIQDQLLYQESLLAKLRNDLDVGKFLLRNLMNKENLDTTLRAQILRVYGDWMAQTKSENPQTVIRKYYLKSIDTSTSFDAETMESVKCLHDTQVALARFADNQFEQISSYMKSPQFENLKECVTYSYKGLSTHSVSADRDIRSALILNQRQNTNDVAELEHIQKERDNYLILALKYYLITLQQSENYNLLVFRVVALWLDNMHQGEVNDILQENLNKIAAFKFIPLIPQLAAHINNELNDFSKKIYNIIQRCALEHPHHTLPVLLALKNLYGDHDYNSSRPYRSVEPRVLGAQKLLQELAGTDISLIVQQMEKLSHALVMLANLTTSANKSGTMFKIPRNQELLKVKDFDKIYVPTLTINVRPSRNYNDVVGVAKYVQSYETVGGINAPKKLICIGTDGVHRHQLIKGKDDLRQDAVMQQVFNVMNTLLRSYKETKRRKLHIRTYKVVPLTQRSGILEWCDNTVPIITVLIGSNGAHGLHKKYYPKDYTANSCKEMLAKVGKSSTDEKLKVFMDCCTHMHPVMHHFFTEKYPSPETWFERRLAYTRSIATTSMAGYVLGLGDRHLNNILIDQSTAEVIHIDFGIAFEQGKVLPVPETIPFRLTRNIEAGMGVSGIEGTMRHCCEKTLSVLRDQRQIIITLLQVLLYDPLFKWTITPAKAHDIQSGSSSYLIETSQCSTGTNKTAERALLRIEQKLQGTEEGLASSVSGQVERLMQQARDPINLCRLYVGWQPYL